jgi:TATA-binding protein-associated factor Taf7
MDSVSSSLTWFVAVDGDWPDGLMIDLTLNSSDSLDSDDNELLSPTFDDDDDDDDDDDGDDNDDEVENENDDNRSSDDTRRTILISNEYRSIWSMSSSVNRWTRHDE